MSPEAPLCSEVETGHRNRAIAHLLRNFSILELMAATLANGGVNPITRERAKSLLTNVCQTVTRLRHEVSTLAQ